MTFGKTIFGDNQFLGVNHSDQARAAELYAKYARPDAIIETLGHAFDAGIRDFMFTTHERYMPVFDEVRRSNLFPGLHFSPCLPYAHKYANALSEQGPAAVLYANLRHLNPLRLGWAGLLAATGDFSGIMKRLIDMELHMCRGLPVRGVFLQNVLVDLLMGLGTKQLIEQFHRFVADELKFLPGYITINHSLAVDVLCGDIGLEQPWLCSNLNVIGYRVNPSLEAVEASFSSGRSRNIAMSVFASGSAGNAASLDYLGSVGGVDAVLFGSSSAQNIRANKEQIEAVLGTAN